MKMFKVSSGIKLKLSILLMIFCASIICGAKVIDRVIAVINDDEILLSEFSKVSEPLIQEYKKKNHCPHCEMDVATNKEIPYY